MKKNVLKRENVNIYKMNKIKLVNITLEVMDHNVTGLEDHLTEHFNVISYKIIPDTKKLYESDPVFKALVKGVKKAQDIRDKYINEKN